MATVYTCTGISYSTGVLVRETFVCLTRARVPEIGVARGLDGGLPDFDARCGLRAAAAPNFAKAAAVSIVSSTIRSTVFAAAGRSRAATCAVDVGATGLLSCWCRF